MLVFSFPCAPGPLLPQGNRRAGRREGRRQLGGSRGAVGSRGVILVWCLKITRDGELRPRPRRLSQHAAELSWAQGALYPPSPPGCPPAASEKSDWGRALWVGRPRPGWGRGGGSEQAVRRSGGARGQRGQRALESGLLLHAATRTPGRVTDTASRPHRGQRGRGRRSGRRVTPRWLSRAWGRVWGLVVAAVFPHVREEQSLQMSLLFMGQFFLFFRENRNSPAGR